MISGFLIFLFRQQKGTFKRTRPWLPFFFYSFGILPLKALGPDARTRRHVVWSAKPEGDWGLPPGLVSALPKIIFVRQGSLKIHVAQLKHGFLH